MSPAEATESESRAGRILIIEDDDTLRLLEAISFRRAGWEVVEAPNGLDGVAMAAAALPDVIICDRMLPDVDGLDVIAFLARDPATASTPVVIVSGMSETHDIAAGMDAGAYDYVVKPFKMTDLEVRCQAALRMGGRQRILAAPEYESRLSSEGRNADEWPSQPAAIVASCDDGPLPGPGPRVLLADDAPMNQIVAMALLERLGYSVDVVDNGAEAVAAVQRTRYHAVLMDCLMPVMDGYEATARIRALAAPAGRTPVIAVTALAMVGDREKCLAAGMDDYVSKPIDPAALAAALDKAIGTSPGTGPAAAPASPGSGPAGTDPAAADGPAGTDPAAAPGTRRAAGPGPGAGAEQDGIDTAMVEGLRRLEDMIGRTAFAEVYEAFLRTSPIQIREIDDAVAAGDVQTTRRLAHKLKGSMQSFGAARLGELAAQLERGDQDAERLASMVAEMDREFARVREIVSRTVASN